MVKSTGNSGFIQWQSLLTPVELRFFSDTSSTLTALNRCFSFNSRVKKMMAMMKNNQFSFQYDVHRSSHMGSDQQGRSIGMSVRMIVECDINFLPSQTHVVKVAD